MSGSHGRPADPAARGCGGGRMMRAVRHLVLLARLALGACAVGPNYRPAPTPPAAAGHFAAADSIAVSSEPLPDKWWQLYDDPALDALVVEALTANTDLRVATANLRQARAILSETRSERLPTTRPFGVGELSAQQRVEQRRHAARPADGSTGPTGTTGTGPGRHRDGGTTAAGTSTTFTGGGYQGPFYSAGLDVSYELDLYGRVKRDIEASRADVAAQEAQRDTVRTSVAAETARAYADACSAALQIGVAQRSLKLQSDTYDLTVRLADAGRDTPLDTSRARAQYEQVRATLPPFLAQRRDALYRLSVLTGHPPEEIAPAAAACTTPPALKHPVPVGDGTALIKRRPDIRQADRTLAAATARIGVATAALYPQISLGGSIGTSGISRQPARQQLGLPLQRRAAAQLDLSQHRRRPRAHPPGAGVERGGAGELRRHRPDGAAGDRDGAVRSRRRTRPSGGADGDPRLQRGSGADRQSALRRGRGEFPRRPRRPTDARHRRSGAGGVAGGAGRPIRSRCSRRSAAAGKTRPKQSSPKN